MHTVARMCRADRYLDALPSAADPAVDGGPVSLPASGIVMHGIRSAIVSFGS